MNEINNLYNEIGSILSIQNKGLHKNMCKFTEEFGELIRALNKSTGVKVSNLNESEIKEEIVEEMADVLQNLLCLAVIMEITPQEILLMIKEKNKKWRLLINLGEQ